MRVAMLAWALVLVHGWASVGKSYCVDCFTPYTAFYAPLMVGVGAISMSQAWERRLRLRAHLLLLVLLFSVLATSNFPLLLDALSHTFQRMGLFAGYIFLRGMLAGPRAYFFSGMSLYAASETFWTGMLLLAFLPAAFLLWRRKPRWLIPARSAWGASLGVLFVLSPLTLLSSAWQPYDCAADVLVAHRKAAEEIARTLPAGTVVYWDAYPPTVLLRTHGITIFPQQLNDHYNFRRGGNPQVLSSWGYWNDALGKEWLAAADGVLTDLHTLRDVYPTRLKSAGFSVEKEVLLVPACLGRKGKLEILRRSQP